MFDLGRLEAPTVGSLMDCIRDDFMYMADSEHLAIAQDSRVVYIIYTYIYIIYDYYVNYCVSSLAHNSMSVTCILSTGTLNDQPALWSRGGSGNWSVKVKTTLPAGWGKQGGPRPAE